MVPYPHPPPLLQNPILNTWTVPPANQRVVQGLSFAPATMFTRPTPSTPARSLGH